MDHLQETHDIYTQGQGRGYGGDTACRRMAWPPPVLHVVSAFRNNREVVTFLEPSLKRLEMAVRVKGRCGVYGISMWQGRFTF